MILYPMIISAVAVLATLVYASYLDIKDRRVPFRTWIPMLIIGIPSTIWLLFDTTANLSLIAGYLALVAAFFYANYLDSREETNPVKFQYLAVVLVPSGDFLVCPRKDRYFFTCSLVWHVCRNSCVHYLRRIQKIASADDKAEEKDAAGKYQ